MTAYAIVRPCCDVKAAQKYRPAWCTRERDDGARVRRRDAGIAASGGSFAMLPRKGLANSDLFTVAFYRGL
jgi:hypothetical protein